MKRKCKELISTNDGKRAIYIDEENSREILDYFHEDERHRKKLQFITEIILGGHKNPKVYDKEEINSKCKNAVSYTHLTLPTSDLV